MTNMTHTTPHLALARKWRPRNFEQMVGQDNAILALTHALNRQQLHHAYLFTGTRGVGKTTLARIIAKCLNCDLGISATPCNTCASCSEIDAGRYPDLFEVDAASRTKVEDTRDLLDNVPYAPTKGRYKVYLIDEVHMLSGHSFNALLKTLEEPPAHVKFLLATTDPQKLPATVLSRCLQFHLRPIAAPVIAAQLNHILTAENIPFEEEATALIAKAADGSLRDALSLLDQSIAFGNQAVRLHTLKSLLGTIEPTALFDILTALVEKNGVALLEASNLLYQQGIDFSKALQELLSLFHQITLIQLIPDYKVEALHAQLQPFAKSWSPQTLQLFYQIALIGQRDLALAPTPRTGFEMVLLRLLAFVPGQIINHTEEASVATTLNHWPDIYQQLNLEGPSKALAKQCSLLSFEKEILRLSLSPLHKPLLKDKYQETIASAVSQLFKKTITVTIEVADNSPTNEEKSPANFEKQQRQSAQTQAEQAITQDETVQKIMQAFDAKMVEGSIVPNLK